jgi:hypothetical protein
MGDYTPIMLITCRANERSPIIAVSLQETVNASMTESGAWSIPVRVRLDEQAARRETWRSVQTLTMVVSPPGFTRVNALTKGTTWRIEIPTYQTGRALARFDVRGLSQHLKGLSANCGRH